MKRRYTIETLKAGQARPYGPTVYRHRITYEWQDMAGFKNPDAPFVRSNMTDEETAKKDARHFSGWEDPNPNDAMSDHFRTKLVYLKMIEPGMWEWETSAAYTD